eukprot:Gb_37767 [translate_table: standard]
MGLPTLFNRKKSPTPKPSDNNNITPAGHKASPGHAACFRKSVSPLPTAEELEIVFNKFDANGDGKISWSELGGVMRSLGCNASDEEIRLMVAQADSDGDGFIDLSEFVELNTKGIDNAGSLRDLREAFKIFDMDGNGSISAYELHKVLKSLGEGCSLEDCHAMIRGVDSDGDGSVSFPEFLNMMTSSA